MISLPTPSVTLSAVCVVIICLVAYYTWVWLINAQGGGLKEWVDNDFPEITHTPKRTWFTGFRFKRHGEEAIAMLDQPVFLEYEDAGFLGKFGAVDSFAWNIKDKEQTAYDFGVEIELLVGGQLAVTEKFKKISITEIEPIIEDSACERHD
ncbi:hypothetical protein [Pseudomonas phage D6]|nr:hypothetical protein [Pseudomonas phage D6]